jgi:hypothetical protein
MNKMMKYPRRETPSAITTILASPQGVTPLEQVVSIIRPRSTLAVSYQRGSDLVSVFQIAAKHINRTGFLPKPDNFDVIQLPDPVNRDEFLRPYDVLMVTSGQRMGEVSIAPPETPEPGAGGWVVNRSLTILRANNPDDAICLVVFLRSELGWTAMLELTPGAVRAHFPDRKLRQIPIPVMIEAHRNQATDLLEKQEALRKKLSEIQ